MALRTLYDLDIGMDLTKLTGLHRLVMGLAGVEQPSSRPVTGSQLFDVESGIISTWVRNVRETDLTESFPYLPELVGQSEVRLVMGTGSGLDSVAEWLPRLELDATPEQSAEILTRVKEVSLATKSLLTESQFAEIARAVLAGASPATR